MIKARVSHRWYDHDPTVSLAVSILRNISQEKQLLVADLIIENAKKHNLQLKEKNFMQKIQTFCKRWYDFDEKMYNALEYLRISPPEVQKTLSLEIINYLCSFEDSSINDCFLN